MMACGRTNIPTKTIMFDSSIASRESSYWILGSWILRVSCLRVCVSFLATVCVVSLFSLSLVLTILLSSSEFRLNSKMVFTKLLTVISLSSFLASPLISSHRLHESIACAPSFWWSLSCPYVRKTLCPVKVWVLWSYITFHSCARRPMARVPATISSPIVDTALYAVSFNCQCSCPNPRSVGDDWLNCFGE